VKSASRFRPQRKVTVWRAKRSERLFEAHDMHRIFAEVDDRNRAAHQVLERLGFRCEARRFRLDEKQQCAATGTALSGGRFGLTSARERCRQSSRNGSACVVIARTRR
jgi:hypothetical protein